MSRMLIDQYSCLIHFCTVPKEYKYCFFGIQSISHRIPVCLGVSQKSARFQREKPRSLMAHRSCDFWKIRPAEGVLIVIVRHLSGFSFVSSRDMDQLVFRHSAGEFGRNRWTFSQARLTERGISDSLTAICFYRRHAAVAAWIARASKSGNDASRLTDWKNSRLCRQSPNHNQTRRRRKPMRPLWNAG